MANAGGRGRGGDLHGGAVGPRLHPAARAVVVGSPAVRERRPGRCSRPDDARILPRLRGSPMVHAGDKRPGGLCCSRRDTGTASLRVVVYDASVREYAVTATASALFLLL